MPYNVPTNVQYIFIAEVQPSGTAGGTFTSGAWNVRTLNTILNDDTNEVSLSGNLITLPPGKFSCKINAPGYAVFAHQAVLYNNTDAVTQLVGTSAYTSTGVTTLSVVQGEITLLTAKDFYLLHRSQFDQATYGYGVPANFGQNEYYSTVEFWKIG